jgi:hypothetical protein
MNTEKPGLSSAAAEKGHDMIARDEISSRKGKGRKHVRDLGCEQADIVDILRRSCAGVRLGGVLSPDARSFYASLPDLISIYRGCERGGNAATDKTVAGKFAEGRQWTNRQPRLGQAQIPKQYVLAVFTDREEHEIIVDPRRLRRLSIESG